MSSGGTDGALDDAFWLKRYSPKRESLRRKVRERRPPQEWYDADMACPFCADPDATEVDDNPESEEPNAG